MRKRNRMRGQALVMVTVALVAMFGVIGLAVDFGWMFFVRKNARSAADAAALAAAKRAFVGVSTPGPFSCSVSCLPNQPCMMCQAPSLCSSPPAGNLQNGCQYAISHGFTADEVRIEANTTSPFETGTGAVNVYYWVTATVTRQVPQLFSTLLGNPTGTVSARATAAILQSTIDASFIILNRQNDPYYDTSSGRYVYGSNVRIGGTGSITVEGNVLMASNCSGSSTGAGNCTDGVKVQYAGQAWGNGSLYTNPGNIDIYGSGNVDPRDIDHWNPLPTNTPNPVNDPLAGRGQPPVPAAYSRDVPVICQGPNNCVVSGSTLAWDGSSLICPGGNCLPGRYYAADLVGGSPVANRKPLTFDGTVNLGGAGGFGEFVFYGGIKGNNDTTVTFYPGRYVFAGALPGSNGAPGQLIDTSTYFTMRDQTDLTASGPARFGDNTNDAGLLFIFTDGDYSGRIPDAPEPSLASLPFGTVNLQTGATAGGGNKLNYINLHGLNPDLVTDTTLRSFLQDSSILFWWDQQNSLVGYDNTTGVPLGGQGTADTYFAHNPGDPRSPELNLQASPDIHLRGVIYQPRGAWTNLNSGGDYSGALQLITGAFNVTGNGNLNLGVPTKPVTITIVALIQ